MADYVVNMNHDGKLLAENIHAVQVALFGFFAGAVFSSFLQTNPRFIQYFPNYRLDGPHALTFLFVIGVVFSFLAINTGMRYITGFVIVSVNLL